MKLILGAAHRNWGADIVEQKEQQTEADVLMLHRPPAWKGYLTNVLILEAARAETEVLMTYRPPARTAYLTNVLVHMASKRGWGPDVKEAPQIPAKASHSRSICIDEKVVDFEEPGIVNK